MPSYRKYKTEHPFPDVMTKVDQRTWGGIEHQIEATKGHPQTMHEHNKLCELKSDFIVAGLFRQNVLPTLTDTQLITSIRHMRLKIKDADWPAQVLTDLLNRRLTALNAAQDWVGMQQVLDPLNASTFDLFAPTVGSLPSLTEHQRIQTFTTMFWKEIMVTLIGAGKKEVSTVLSLSRSGLTQYSNVDPLEHSNAVCAHVKHWRVIWHYLIALIDPRVGAECQAIVAGKPYTRHN